MKAYDLLINNVRIIDGTGKPAYKGSVAVCDGRIAAVRDCDNLTAKETVDGGGQYLSPGFIDIHTHSDKTLLYYPMAESRIFQGVTTEFGGNCGTSMAPLGKRRKYRKLLCEHLGRNSVKWRSLDDYLRMLETSGTSVNFGMGVGHGTLRIAAMGFDDRTPEADELQEMKRLLQQSIEEGAFFLSSGLIYPPGCFADAEELSALAEVAKSGDIPYMTHMRNEGIEIVSALEEALKVSRATGVATQISHHKVMGKAGWGKLCRETTAMIEEAREEGFDITVDQYPYTASSTSLYTCLPTWAYEGGISRLVNRLKQPDMRSKLVETMKGQPNQWDDIVVSFVSREKNQWMIGKSISTIAMETGKNSEEACIDVLLTDGGKTKIIKHYISEEDIDFIMKKEYTMIGSDGNSLSFDGNGNPHPRSFGTFPRVLSRYCRDKGVITIEEAVYKMTGLPARRLQLQDRGFIKEGGWADFVLFDLETLEDTPSYENPRQKCKGIRRVYVNGVLTAIDGKHTGAKAGKILRKQ